MSSNPLKALRCCLLHLAIYISKDCCTNRRWRPVCQGLLASLQRRTEKCELNEPSRRLTSGSGKIRTQGLIWELGWQTHLVKTLKLLKPKLIKIMMIGPNVEELLCASECASNPQSSLSCRHIVFLFYIHGNWSTGKTSWPRSQN